MHWARSLFVNAPMGNNFGPPDDAAQQLSILRTALALIHEANEGGALKVHDSLAENLALFHVLERQVEREPAHRHRLQRDDEALPGELAHELIEPLAGLDPEQVVAGQPDVIEEQLGDVLRLQPELVEIASAAKSLETVRLHAE